MEDEVVKVTRHYEFEAAHLLPNYDGDCGNLHGHTYKVDVTVAGKQSGAFDMVMDFKKLNQMIKELMPDHRYLHWKGNPISEDIVSVLDKYRLKYYTFDFPTTAENMAKYFKQVLNEYLHNELGYKDLNVTQIDLYETTNSKATY